MDDINMIKRISMLKGTLVLIFCFALQSYFFQTENEEIFFLKAKK